MSKKVVVSFILDETGSMQDVKGQTISGFNEYVQTLRDGENSGSVRFSLTRFNSAKMDTSISGVKLSKVPELTNETYQPANTTPLYDAIGATIRGIEAKYPNKKNVLVVIQTDGQENASKEFDHSAIFALITEKKALGWTFVMVADQDAWATSKVLGIPKGNTLLYAGAKTGQTLSVAAVATATFVSHGGESTGSFWEGDNGETAKKD